MVDMFCGAGIGAVGFKKAGYNIIDAMDNNEYAVRTYNENIGDHARVLNVKAMDDSEFKYADLYVGGFPCTPFSEAGKGKGEQDSKSGDLGYHFFRAVKAVRPKAFIIENVKGLTFKKHRPFFERLLASFEDEGYAISWKVSDCNEYGVAQIRERVFIVGVRKDLNVKYVFPAVIEDSKRPTLKDAIYDIQDRLYDGWLRNHDEYYDGGFSSRYTSRNRQRQWDEPSFTIVSTARQLPLYPEPSNYDIRKMDEYDIPPPRRFTVRECLRIQSVPDWFAFDDDIPLAKQYERCSGIPSLVAYKLGKSLAEQLTKPDESKTE